MPVIKPNTFLVGAAKSGTTSIYHYLTGHKDIFLAPLKEPHFFSKDIRCENFSSKYQKRVCSFDIKKYLAEPILKNQHIAYIEEYEDYIQLFRDAANVKVVFDISTGYLYSSVAAEEISKYDPDAKIIMILRDPVERAYSHWLMGQQINLEDNTSFLDAMLADYKLGSKVWGGASHTYIELGCYYEQVKRYYDNFPAENIKIFLYDDLKRDASLIVEELYAFLAVEKLAIPELEMHNISKIPRNDFTHKIISNKYIKTLFSRLLSRDFKKKIKDYIYTPNKTKLSMEDKEVLLPYFYDDIRKLEKLIRRDLSTWYSIGGGD